MRTQVFEPENSAWRELLALAQTMPEYSPKLGGALLALKAACEKRPDLRDQAITADGRRMLANGEPEPWADVMRRRSAAALDWIEEPKSQSSPAVANPAPRSEPRPDPTVAAYPAASLEPAADSAEGLIRSAIESAALAGCRIRPGVAPKAGAEAEIVCPPGASAQERDLIRSVMESAATAGCLRKSGRAAIGAPELAPSSFEKGIAADASELIASTIEAAALAGCRTTDKGGRSPARPAALIE